MPHYKVYLIGDGGRRPGLPEIVTCGSDQEAASKAVDLSNGRVAELWQGMRLVAIFPKDHLLTGSG
jgi:hypothetical protein